MATNPDLNIVDTLDNATIGQLQQAQQLASSIGNTALSAIIGNAITFALASAGGGGVTTPGQTGNGTPVGPTVTTPAAMGLGIGSSALANATRTTAVTTNSPIAVRPYRVRVSLRISFTTTAIHGRGLNITPIYTMKQCASTSDIVRQHSIQADLSSTDCGILHLPTRLCR